MAQKRVELLHYVDAEDYFSGHVVDIFHKISLFLDSVPLEFRDKVVFEVDTWAEDNHANLNAYYDRPMSQEELDEQKCAREAYAARKTQEEHQLYLSLKAKYGKDA